MIEEKAELITPMMSPNNNMTNPIIRQFFASGLSSSFRTRYAIIPPIILKNIGIKYHPRLLRLVDVLGVSWFKEDKIVPHFEQKLLSDVSSFPHLLQYVIHFFNAPIIKTSSF